jgi:hypothetical protein
MSSSYRFLGWCQQGNARKMDKSTGSHPTIVDFTSSEGDTFEVELPDVKRNAKH